MLNSVSPNHRCHSKAVDDNDPISPVGPPRGYGGVGIIYRKDWNLNVIELPDGGNRVCVIEIQSERPLLVISAYLPSRKYIKKDSAVGDPTEFISTLDQLNEIIHTYESTHSIILCGDMNSSLLKRHGNQQDQMLTDFVSKSQLGHFQSGTSTFFHENNKDESEIDYIFTNCDQNLILKPTTVAERNHLNLSDHTLLSIDIKMNFEAQSVKKIKISVRPKWASCNVHLYKETVRRWIRNSFHDTQAATSMYDLQCQIRTLTDILRGQQKLASQTINQKFSRNLQRINRNGVTMSTLLSVSLGEDGGNGRQLGSLSDLPIPCTFTK